MAMNAGSASVLARTPSGRTWGMAHRLPMGMLVFSTLVVAILLGNIPMLGLSMGTSHTLNLPSRSLAAHRAVPLPPSAMFVRNVGQWDPQALFQGWGGPGTVWLTETGIWWSFMRVPDGSDKKLMESLGLQLWDASAEGQAELGVEQNILLQFLDANPHPRLEPVAPLKTKVSYFHGQSPDAWYTDMPTWGRVRYVDLYPSVDLEVAVQDNEMILNFVCKATCAESLPRVKWVLVGTDGAQAYTLEEADTLGMLSFPTVVGEAHVRVQYMGDSPTGNRVYQEGTTWRIGPGNDDAPRWQGENHPSPQGTITGSWYSTFVGTSAKEYGIAIDADGNGKLYVGGFTFSSRFPTTPGVVDRRFQGTREAFLFKFNTSGTSMEYATFLGGSADDWVQTLWVDTVGYAYVGGFTTSNDFPVTSGAYDTTFNDGVDLFVLKLSPSGSSLVYSTYIGGRLPEYAPAMVVDTSGRVYLAGHTYSKDFPVTTGALDAAHGGYLTDGFVLRLSRGGHRLEYSTFLGGSDVEWISDLAIDSSGNTYVVGYTASRDFPTTRDGVHTSYIGGQYDVFLTRINASGSTLLYGTFLGGIGDDRAAGIALHDGFLYVLGYSDGSISGLRSGYDISRNGGRDVFVMRFRVESMDLVNGTYLGGSDHEGIRSHLLVGDGGVYVVGETASGNFPTTWDAFKRTYSGGSADNFIAILSLDLNQLLYSSYIGGGGEERSYAHILPGVNRLCFTGSTTSSDYPISPITYDASFNGNVDVIVTCLTVPYAPITPTPTPTPTPRPIVSPDAYEPDNECSQAQWLNLNSPQYHNFHQANDVDWVKFNMVAGATYVIETYGLETNADTVLELYTSNCATRLASDDDSGSGRGSRIKWQPNISGIYKASVRPFSTGNTGRNSGYTIKLTQIRQQWSGKIVIPLLLRGDTTPPTISTVWEERDPIHTLGCSGSTRTRIRADVWDTSSGLAWVRLYYRIAGQATWQAHTMNYIRGTTYEATLGPFPTPGQVEYYIWARDRAGNDRKTNIYTLEVRSCATTYYSPVEVIFAVDTSGSMEEEWNSLCSQISDIVNGLQERGITVRYDILGISEPFEAAGSYACTGGKTVRSVVPDSTINSYEDWGPAIIDLASKYPWREGYIRVVTPISDEGPENGNPINQADNVIASQAIRTAQQYKVIVSPILGNNADLEVEQIAAEIAYNTGGVVAKFDQGNMAQIVSDAIANASSYCGRYEPNDNRWNPWGPLHTGVEYEAFLCQGDEEDNYFFEVDGSKMVNIRVTWPSVFVGHGTIWIYSADNLQQHAYLCNQAPIISSQITLSCSLPKGGRYIIRMYADNPDSVYDNDTPYQIEVIPYSATH